MWKFFLIYIGSIVLVSALGILICRVFWIDVPMQAIVLLSILVVVIGAVCVAGIWSKGK